jgi:hypothetical protein
MYPTVSRLAGLSYWLERYCQGEYRRCEEAQRVLAGERSCPAITQSVASTPAASLS